MWKEMKQILVGMALTPQHMPRYKKDLQQIQFQLHKHDICLDRIQRHIHCIIKLAEMPGDSAKDLTPVESASKE